MNASSLYRSTSSLVVGVTLLLSCFVFSGCRLDLIFGYADVKDLFGEHRDQFPSVVLLSEDEKKANYVFNWDDTTMAGVSINKFIPSKNFWRLHVFSFATGKRIDNLEPGYFPLATKRSVTFSDLPLHELLRADLELADDEKGTTGKEMYSFMVLFHYEKTLSE